MSALPRLFAPEEELDPTNIRALEKAVTTGAACVECAESWPTPFHKAPVICQRCANLYLTKLMDQLGYTIRKDRSKNAEAHAQLARERRERTENVDPES